MPAAWTHTTVLLQPAVAALLGAEVSGVRHFVDGTFGRGGHSRRLLQEMGPQDRLTVFDRDPEAIAVARSWTDARLHVVHDSFAALAQWPAASVAGVLLDLGVSSPQLDDPQRGFSFRSDGPLDMRMDPTRGPSVAQWLAEAPAAQIAEVIHDYGEERFAGPIAKAIVARRKTHGPLATTAELAQLVADTVKTREPGQNPATRTFQAFRIFINGELEALEQALAAALNVLQPGGRLAVISFHSLEDRRVKQFMARHAQQQVDRRAPFAPPVALALTLLGRIRPDAAEVAANPRARSAILRVAQRTAAPLAAATRGEGACA